MGIKKPRKARKRKLADISCCPRSAATSRKAKSKTRPGLSKNDECVYPATTRKRRKTSTKSKSKSVRKKRNAKSRTMRSALSSSNRANLPKKAPNAEREKEISAKKKRKKHELSEEEIEDKIEEFRLFLNKHRTERQNKLRELDKAKKRALAAIEEEYRLKRIQIDCDLNPKINDDLNRLNESVIALEDLDDDSDDDDDDVSKAKVKEVFCRVCFERDSLSACRECGLKCCEACRSECDREGCEASYCEDCAKEALKTLHCGFCDFCKECKVKYGGKDNHSEHCLK